MALRNIRTDNDPILRKISKPVTGMTDRLRILIGDMYETMYEAGGVGIAAPQVGVLKCIFVVDCGTGEERDPHTFINPEIIEADGEQTGLEGCLSVPGYQGTVTRAESVRVRYLDEDMHECELFAEGLLARAVQHEADHLRGVLYTDIAEGELIDLSEEPAEESE